MIITDSIANKCIYLFLLNLNLAGVLPSAASIREKQERQIDKCTEEQFQCENGRCIAQPFFCDGILDCEDGSDETYNQCHNISCSEDHFKCNYGACISKKYQCDGLKQCLDGSDKSTTACSKTHPLKRRKRAPNDSCAIPSLSLDRMITYNCQPNCDTRKGYVPGMTIALIECKPTYYPENGPTSPSFCYNQTWLPSLESCYKKCDQLNPINVDLRCNRNGRTIACDENSLIAGSKVRPTCRTLHRYSDIPPDYIEITCKENGKWDKSLFSCVPECGRSYIDLPATRGKIEQRISGGVEEHYGDSPWHVAIYNERKVLICGGTIINPYIVLSAAHCFAANGTIVNNSANYEVVVSKVSRNYSMIDNDNQQAYKIKEIRPSNKGYFDLSSYFTADIVALILEDKISIRASVLPACVDWIGLSTKSNPAEGTPAKVSGWGLNERGTYSETLMTTNLSFISHEHCFNTVPDDFKPYITFDKFCAGAEEGPSAQQGDSGGGLLFPLQIQKDWSYFLRGIVSLKQPTITAISAFTDLADHIDWLSTVRNEVESRVALPLKKTPLGISGERICSNYNVSNCIRVQDCSIVDILITTKTAIYCGYDTNGDEAEKICCKFQDTPKEPTTISTPVIQDEPKKTYYAPHENGISKKSVEIVTSYCEEYSKYATDCVSDVPQTGKRSAAFLKEYPHIAYIGCENITAMGALISEQFVLSVAFCNVNGNGNAKWVHLGSLNQSLDSKSKTDGGLYDIERIYIHPDYSYPRNSIVLYKLKTTVAFNSFIRPACLYTSNFNLINSQLRMANWGTYSILNSQSKVLTKGSVTVVNDQRCSNMKEYDPDSMVCAGDEADGEALCLISAGTPLQIQIRNASCMWSVYALQFAYSARPTSCENPRNVKPLIYTKVSHYVDWIQSIVWPTSSMQNIQKVSPTAVAVRAGTTPMPSVVRVPQNEPKKTYAPDDQRTMKTPAEIASSYCAEYSKFATDCVSDVPPAGKRSTAVLKEYPYIAIIECQNGTFTGSLISEQFVLSVAFCDVDGKPAAKWVHLGALSQDNNAGSAKNEMYDRKYDIERSYVHPNYSYTRHSIVLYKLRTAVIFNSFIRPACLSTSNLSRINSKLRIVSWGTYAVVGSYSKDLKKSSITVVEDQRCSAFKAYDSNSMVCVGDVADQEGLCLMGAGSPLQIMTQNRSCLWSIYAMHFAYSSSRPDSCEKIENVKPLVFTKVSYYLDWIQSIVWPTSSQKMKLLTAVPPRTTTLLPAAAIVPRNDPKKTYNASVQRRILKTPAEVASSYCEEYSKYATDCVHDTPPTGKRSAALLKEYPHIAYIGCKSNNSSGTYYTCTGSLISSQFVLSVAFCGVLGNGNAEWIHVGALNKKKVEKHSALYDVERTYIHPNYSFPRYSIALYKLKTTVVFNSFIRPACLYTSNINQINSKLRIASWGAYSVAGALSDDLKKGTITVVEDQKCPYTFYDPNSMVCAGEKTDLEALCLISVGSPLQILTRNTSCTWSIYAMYVSYHTLPDSCEKPGNAEPQHFTKVSYYLDWIQNIVWPQKL